MPATTSGVTITDVLPAGVSLVSATPSRGTCSGTSTVTCDLGIFPSAATATVDIVVQVAANASGTLTNTATVAALTNDPSPDNNTATEVTSVTSCVPVNVALASAGSVAIALSHSSGNFPALSAIDGDRTGASWGTSIGGWNDNTRNAYPDIFEVDFPVTESIGQINVFTLQNNWTTAGEPTLASPATGEGILDFIVQYCSDDCDTIPVWTTIPGGNVTGNDKAWRLFSFPAVTTSKIRVVVNNSRNNWSRIVELEAYGCPP